MFVNKAHRGDPYLLFLAKYNPICNMLRQNNRYTHTHSITILLSRQIQICRYLVVFIHTFDLYAKLRIQKLHTIFSICTSPLQRISKHTDSKFYI